MMLGQGRIDDHINAVGVLARVRSAPGAAEWSPGRRSCWLGAGPAVIRVSPGWTAGATFGSLAHVGLDPDNSPSLRLRYLE
jgi:hypothetical protein